MGDVCNLSISAPNAGVYAGIDPMVMIVIGGLILLFAIVISYPIRKKRFTGSMKGLFVVAALITSLAAGNTNTSVLYAAPDDCNTAVTDPADPNPAAIDAVNDIIRPQGNFPSNHPSAYGWLWGGYYPTDQFTELSSDGNNSQSHSSVSIPVVRSNDTGVLDTNTVDLNPQLPGVQREIIVLASGHYVGSSEVPIQAYRYRYDPVTDIVSVTNVSSTIGLDDLLDQYGSNPAYRDFIDEHIALHGTYPNYEERARFVASYLEEQGLQVVTRLTTKDEVKSLGIVQYMSSYDDISAYEIRVPYTVRSVDGSGVTGAEIILPLVQYYMFI